MAHSNGFAPTLPTLPPVFIACTDPGLDTVIPGFALAALAGAGAPKSASSSRSDS